MWEDNSGWAFYTAESIIMEYELVFWPEASV